MKNRESTIKNSGEQAMLVTGVLLVATVWLSAGLFGLYILAFYASSLFNGNLQKWNTILPNLYDEHSTAAVSGIGLHFATGGIILLLGSIQLIEAIRIHYPIFHRWVGRLYVVSCLAAAVGGMLFIVVKGTIGGFVMNVGFSLYGILMLISSVQTIRFARLGNYTLHRAWALRLYALAIGSWLYRIDYGFWFLLAGKAGHHNDFTGVTDRVMAFFFYIPNLAVAELFIHRQNQRYSVSFAFAAALAQLLCTGVLLTGTYYFTLFYWGPAIADWFHGKG